MPFYTHTHVIYDCKQQTDRASAFVSDKFSARAGGSRYFAHICSFITVQNLVTVSNTVRACIRGSKIGDAGHPASLDGAWLTPYLVAVCQTVWAYVGGPNFFLGEDWGPPHLGRRHG